MAAGSKALSVLFVDDEVNILKSLRRLFMDEDFEPLVAASGPEGLELLRATENVAVIVSDQRMPGMSGVEFLQNAKEIRPDAIRIILTGYADVQAAIDAINQGGAWRYLSKPWDDTDLTLTIHQAIRFYEMKEENERFARIIQKQNEELESWNSDLEARVSQQTREARERNEALEQANERLASIFENTINAFAGLVELRDRRLSNHSRNVARVAARAALLLGMSEAEQLDIRRAAMLHDIGKIGVSDLLLKTDREKMGKDELQEYLQHAVRGQAAIDAIEELQEVGRLIRHHHEQFDGSGSPDGLEGSQIPRGSMLIAMADYVDNLVRRGGGASPVVYALGALKTLAGSIFDPACYSAIEKAAMAELDSSTMATDKAELEMAIRDILPGMVLSRECRSGTGVLLLSRGVKLDQASIHSLKRFYRLDPPKHGVFVWEKA